MGQVHRACSCRVRNQTCGLKTLVKRITCLARNGPEFGITFGNRVKKPTIALSCPLYRSLCGLLMGRVQLRFQHLTSFYLGNSLITPYQWIPLGPASREVRVLLDSAVSWLIQLHSKCGRSLHHLSSSNIQYSVYQTEIVNKCFLKKSFLTSE